jgi:O-6-methylguanine DNA methyltransferase
VITLHVDKLEDLWCGVAVEEKKIIATMFAFREENTFEGLLKELPYNTVFQAVKERDAFAEEVLRAVKAVYDGEDVSFNYEFAMNRIPRHSQRVLRLTSLIPTGYVTTYGALAKAAAGGPRSVGRVMATNPFAPLVPCHRVVGADMTLRGYGGGLRLKWEILQREDRGFAEAVEPKIGGRALKLFPIRMVKPPKRA